MDPTFRQFQQSRLFSHVASATWVITLAGTLLTLNQSLFRVLALLVATSSEPQPTVVYAYAFMELVRTFLSGWLFFAVFYRPGSKSMLPSAKIRKNPNELLTMLLLSIFVASSRMLLLEVTVRAFGLEPLLTNLKSVFLSLTAIASGIIVAISWLRSRTRLEQNLVDELHSLPKLKKLQNKALQKINNRLSEEERIELANLLYQSNQIQQATVQNLAKWVWYGLVVAFLYEIAEEIFRRL